MRKENKQGVKHIIDNNIFMVKYLYIIFQHKIRRAACLYTYAMIQGQTSSGWSTT